MPLAHTEVPPVYPAPGSKHAGNRERILREAKEEPFELLMFGSSLHSFSTVSGNHYMPGMNAAFAAVYQNAWATPWIPPASFGSTPSAQFCLRASRPNTVDPTGLINDYLPPNWSVRKLSHASANFAFQLEPDGWAMAPLARAMQGAYIKPGETIKPWWIGWSIGEATEEGGQDTTFGFITRKQAAGVTGAIFGGGTLLSNVTTVNIPASSPTTGQTFTPGSATHMARELDFPATNGAVGITYTHDASLPYYNMQISSAAVPTNHILCAGARWTNQTSRYGICASTVSVGGAKVGDFLANHSLSWETLRAMVGNRRRIVAISLQANSAYNGIVARDDGDEGNSYYHLMQVFIDAIIANINPELIVLISDGTRVDGSAGEDDEYSQMVGADVQIADSRPGLVHVVNSRLALEQLGYTEACETMTGYTFRNEWASTTAYSAGDIVSFGEPGYQAYFRCIVGHTAASTDKPMSGTNWQSYWRRHRQFLTEGTNLTTAPSDVVHHGGPGGWMKGMLDVSLLFSGNTGFVNPHIWRAR